MNQREIKFRAWDETHKNMVKPTSIEFRDTGEFDVLPAKEGSIFSLMQFTGLHDKNGKEIYEGDIIQTRGGFIAPGADSEIGVVEWEHDGFTCLMHPKNRIVIGNIYENPDLLK